MKLLIASDLHGSAYYCRLLMEAIHREQPDKVVLLGDLLYHGPRNDLPREYSPREVIPMLSSIKDKVIAVRGNCDAEVDQMVLPFPCMADYALLAPEPDVTVYATHGHLHDPEHLPPLPKGSIFLSGHTHMRRKEWLGHCLVLNPGSVSLPKDDRESYLIYNQKAFIFKALDGTVLDSIAI